MSGPRARGYSPEQENRIRALRADNKSWPDIAAELRTQPDRLRRYALRVLKLPRYLPGYTPPAPQPATQPPPDPHREPLPAGHPVSWGAISDEPWPNPDRGGSRLFHVGANN